MMDVDVNLEGIGIPIVRGISFPSSNVNGMGLGLDGMSIRMEGIGGMTNGNGSVKMNGHGSVSVRGTSVSPEDVIMRTG